MSYNKVLAGRVQWRSRSWSPNLDFEMIGSNYFFSLQLACRRRLLWVLDVNQDSSSPPWGIFHYHHHRSIEQWIYNIICWLTLFCQSNIKWWTCISQITFELLPRSVSGRSGTFFNKFDQFYFWPELPVSHWHSCTNAAKNWFFPVFFLSPTPHHVVVSMLSWLKSATTFLLFSWFPTLFPHFTQLNYDTFSDG